jgi:hypothetical protein
MGLRAAELFNEQFDFALMEKISSPFSRTRKKLIATNFTDAIAVIITCQGKVARIAMLTPRGFRVYSIQTPHLPAFQNSLSCAA